MKLIRNNTKKPMMVTGVLLYPGHHRLVPDHVYETFFPQQASDQEAEATQPKTRRGRAKKEVIPDDSDVGTTDNSVSTEQPDTDSSGD